MPDSILVQECRRQDHAFCARTHFHHAYEMLYIRRGRVRVQVAGQQYEATAPALVFFGCFEAHATLLPEAGCERYYAILSASAADRLIGEGRLLAVFKNRPKNFCHVFDCAPIAARTDALFETMCAELAAPGAFSEQLTGSILREVLIQLYRLDAARFPVPPRPIRREIYEIRQFIEHHFAEDVRIQELAARYYLDPCYLSHRFRELTGYSPKQYLMLNRISCARELLSTTDVPVSEAAYKSGFGDLNNFIRSFKKETGLTPGEYRSGGGG